MNIQKGMRQSMLMVYVADCRIPSDSPDKSSMSEFAALNILRLGRSHQAEA
jgi:hypothetical protein